MKLNHWINKHDRKERGSLRRRLAKRLGVSEVYVRSMVNGNRRIPAEFVRTIESFTRGEVSPHDQRPDVFGRAPKKPMPSDEVPAVMPQAT